jgi:hypothetical protein
VVPSRPSARTNPRLRREIQQSAESNRALASRLGLNEKTVAKWKGRRTTSDARKGPKQRVSTVLDVVEEALIVVFRKRTRLPVDDCLVCLKPMIPALPSWAAFTMNFHSDASSTTPEGS